MCTSSPNPVGRVWGPESCSRERIGAASRVCRDRQVGVVIGIVAVGCVDGFCFQCLVRHGRARMAKLRLDEGGFAQPRIGVNIIFTDIVDFSHTVIAGAIVDPVTGPVWTWARSRSPPIVACVHVCGTARIYAIAGVELDGGVVDGDLSVVPGIDAISNRSGPAPLYSIVALDKLTAASSMLMPPNNWVALQEP